MLTTTLLAAHSDLSSLTASVSSLLAELSFPELSSLEKHLAANPMPPGGLPALQRQAADALAVVRLQDAVREERNQWWKDKDQVESELEDERERRRTLELEVQELRRANSKCAPLHAAALRPQADTLFAHPTEASIPPPTQPYQRHRPLRGRLL